MGPRSKNCPGSELKSGHERFGRYERRRDRSFGNTGHADSIKVYLGQVGLSFARRALEILEEQGSVIAHKNGRADSFYRNENEKKTTGLHAARDHARSKHHRDHIGSGDFKTWQHYRHRKNDAGSSGRPGDQNAIAAV